MEQKQLDDRIGPMLETTDDMSDELKECIKVYIQAASVLDKKVLEELKSYKQPTWSID